MTQRPFRRSSSQPGSGSFRSGLRPVRGNWAERPRRDPRRAAGRLDIRAKARARLRLRGRADASPLSRGGRGRLLLRLRHRCTEHRVARVQPEPAATRVRERGGAASTARIGVARPDLGDLGLHAHLRPLGCLARRAAPASARGWSAHRHDSRARAIGGVGAGHARSESRAWRQDPRRGRPNRNERSPSRTLVGSRRPGGFSLGLVGRGALGPRLRNPHAARGRLSLPCPAGEARVSSWPGNGRPTSPSRRSRESIPPTSGRSRLFATTFGSSTTSRKQSAQQVSRET